jgi:hypothetical protein
MGRFTLALSLALGLAEPAAGRAPSALERCTQQAQACAQTLIEGKYAELAACTLPKLIEQIGGAQKMIDILTKGRAQMRSDGADFEAVRVEPPQRLVAGGRETYAIVPTRLTLKVEGGKLLKKSFLLAVSTDKGKTWKFLDGANLDAAKLKIMLPAVPPELTLPPREEPIFEPGKGDAH